MLVILLDIAANMNVTNKTVSLLGSFLILCFFSSCNSIEPKNLAVTCAQSNAEYPKNISFSGEAKHFNISPFDEDMLLVNVVDSANHLLEINLATQICEKLDVNHWKQMHQSKYPVYHYPGDSLVWIGSPHRPLKSYNRNTRQIKRHPLNMVTRIIPYRERLYFVSREGLFYLDSIGQQIEKIPGLSAYNFEQSQVFNQDQLILNSDLTFDLSKASWKEGIQAFNRPINTQWHSFKSQDSIFIHQKNRKIYLVNQQGEKELNFFPSIAGIFISSPFIYEKQHDYIKQYDVSKDSMITWPYCLPDKNNYSLNYEEDNRQIWMSRPGQLYRLDTQTGLQYEAISDDDFVQFQFDDCRIFLLYKNRVEIHIKSEFIRQNTVFDCQLYQQEIRNFKSYIEETGIRSLTDNKAVTASLKNIQLKYLHNELPEIQEGLESLKTSAYNSVSIERNTAKESCYKDKELPLARRKYCFDQLASHLAQTYDFKDINQHFQQFFDSLNIEQKEQIKESSYNISKLKKYLADIDSLNTSKLTSDEKTYKKALAAETVNTTTWFCHEGCGGCDYRFTTKQLQDFIAKNPTSEFADDAAYKILMLTYQYYESQGGDKKLRPSFEAFIKQYPKSNLAIDAREFIIKYEKVMHYQEY